MSARLHRLLVMASLLLWAITDLAAQGATQPVIRIRLGTVVPPGSPWDETLQGIRQEWRRVLGPRLDMAIIAGLGDESDLVRKLRQGQIQAVGLSSVGLSRIDNSVSCLQVPMMLDSYEELDHVRDRLAPDLERRLESKGYKVLHWADGGWVYAFTKRPARTPDELRLMKLYTSAGDPETERLYKDLRFNVIPLSLTDMVTSLQTGIIDAFATVPLFAQLQDSFKLAPNMTNVKWTPLVGGTVISRSAWASLPDESKPALLEAARRQGGRLRSEIRRMGDVAVQEMQKRGLKVIDVDAAVRRTWRNEAEGAYPRLRGQYCPADVFDHVKRLRDEFRANAPSKPEVSSGGR